MGTEILKSFGTLQSELEQARSSLKGVDENIKRLIGRDPSEFPPRGTNVKRGGGGNTNNSTLVDDRGGGGGRSRIIRNRNNPEHDQDEPPATKRRHNNNNNNNGSGLSVFKRLSEKPLNRYDDDSTIAPKQMIISKVIVTPKELPSRQDALAAQSKDERSKERNRRMFGALLGTLQKFQQEETRLKQKEDKRAQLERKIEEHEIKEKEEIKKERQELFFNRKKKQAEIKMIELKMMRMKEYACWEERQKPRMNFMQTKAKPHVHFLPRRLNEKNKELLESCRVDIEKMIDKKRQEVFDELQHIEERMKKNFEMRKSKDEKENNNEDIINEDDDVAATAADDKLVETVEAAELPISQEDGDVQMLAVDADEEDSSSLIKQPLLAVSDDLVLNQPATTAQIDDDNNIMDKEDYNDTNNDDDKSVNCVTVVENNSINDDDNHLLSLDNKNNSKDNNIIMDGDVNNVQQTNDGDDDDCCV